MQIRSFMKFGAAMLVGIASIPTFAHNAAPDSFPFGHPGDAKKVDHVITIQAGDIFFEPKMLTVQAGQTVKFIVINIGKLPHEFILGNKSEQEEHEKEMLAKHNTIMMENDANGIAVAPGESGTLIWKFTSPGTIKFGCHEPGHYAAGMVGTIKILSAGRR